MKSNSIVSMRKLSPAYVSKRFIFVLFFLLSCTLAQAVTNSAQASGPWETAGNWSLGHAPLASEDVNIPAPFAMTINANDVCLSLTIASGASVSSGAFSLSIGGNFANNGTFTGAANSTLIFNAASNSTVTGTGTFTVKNITLNLNAKTTVLDVQSANFIAGINTGNVYNFTFTQGTWKYNAPAVLNDCHNTGAATALTIPFPVVIEVNAGTMNLCKSGTNNNVILSGKLFVNGGAVTALIGQALNAAQDFRYFVNGGTPQLYVSSGSMDCGAGFNAKTTADYIDFNMSGGLIHVADNGPTTGNTFLLQNVVGGSTVMTGGLIALEDACTSASPDVDMGGPNVVPFSVTGGTLEFGYSGTIAGATFFGVQYYTTTNYPNIVFNAGVAKNVGAWNSDGQTFNCLSLYINPSMSFDLTGATPDPTVVFLSSNGVFALDVDGLLTIGTGGVVFKGNVNQLITGTIATLTFNDMTVNMTPGMLTSVGGSVSTINVKNYLQSQGDYAPSTNFNVSANWTHDAGNFIPGTNTVMFNGSGTQQITGLLSSETFYNLVVAKSGTLNTAGNMGTITTQDLAETSGNITLTTLLAPATLNVNGNYLLTAGTFTPSATTNVAGNWTKNGGTFTPGTGRVLFNGSSNSQTIGGTGSTTFYDLSTTNTFATAPQLTLGIATNITDNLTMTSGLVNLAGFTLTLGTSAANAGTLTYTAGWLYGGTFKRWFATTILPLSNARGHFPMGSPTDYHPLWLGYSTALTTGGSMSVTHNPSGQGSNAITPYLDVTWTKTVTGVSNSIWTLAAANSFALNGASGQLRFGGTGFNVFIAADINASLAASTVGTYGAPTNVTASYFEVNRTGLTLANVNNAWRIGTSDLLLSPLPITLLDFEAKKNGQVVDLTWSTASENNNDYFTIEKTKDGITFETVGTADGAGNSSSLLNYAMVDPSPYEGVSYYRLKQTDYNGNYTYSSFRTVDFNSSDAGFTIYSNPNSGENITLSISAAQEQESTLSVYDAAGRKTFSALLNVGNGKNVYTLQPKEKLAAGIYLLTLTMGTEVYSQRLVVE